MAYSDFTLNNVIKKFSLIADDNPSLFTDINELSSNTYLPEILISL